VNESIAPTLDPPLSPVEPPALLPEEGDLHREVDAIEAKLQAIEAEAEKWMGAKAVWIKKHVADLRNLL
jgi:hypothetical protein